VATEHIAAETGQGRGLAAPEPAHGGRLYMTGDLRALTGLPRTHMDFYLREGIVQPTLRTGSGYLLFDAVELETLRAVLRWRDEGIGIREIRDRLGRPATH
jgi:DNA-binding transcriptional MerR regulator